MKASRLIELLNATIENCGDDEVHVLSTDVLGTDIYDPGAGTRLLVSGVDYVEPGVIAIDAVPRALRTTVVFACTDGDGVAIPHSVRMTNEAAKKVQAFIEGLPASDRE